MKEQPYKVEWWDVSALVTCPCGEEHVVSDDIIVCSCGRKYEILARIKVTEKEKKHDEKKDVVPESGS